VESGLKGSVHDPGKAEEDDEEEDEDLSQVCCLVWRIPYSTTGHGLDCAHVFAPLSNGL
jgi:hypothetical protein